MKKPLSLIMAIVMILTMMLSLTACGKKLTLEDIQTNPEAQMKTSAIKTIETVLAANSESPLFTLVEAAQKGKFGFTVAEAKNTASGLIHIDTDKGAFAIELDSNEEEIKTFLKAYFNNDKIAVSTSGLMSGKMMGIDLNTLEDTVKNSPIWEYMDTTYEENAAAFQDIFKAIDKYAQAKEEKSENNTPAETTAPAESATEGTEGVKETELKNLTDTEKLAKDILNVLKKSTATVKEDNILTEEDVCDAFAISYRVTNEQLLEIFDLCAEQAKKEIGDMSAVDMLTEEEDEFEQTRVSIRSDIKKTQTALNIKFLIHPETEVIMKVECEMTRNVDGRDEAVKMSLEFGIDPATTKQYEVRIIISKPESEYEENISLKYERKGNENTYARKITYTVSENGEDEFIGCEFTVDKTDGAYDLILSSTEGKTTLSGIYKNANKKVEMSVTSVTDKEGTEEGNITFTVEAGIDVPAVPEFTNIFNLTQEEFETLYAEVMGEPLYRTPVVMFEINDGEESVYLEQELGNGNLYLLLTQFNMVTFETNKKDELVGIESVQEVIPEKGYEWKLYVNFEEVELASIMDLQLDEDDWVTLVIEEIPESNKKK